MSEFVRLVDEFINELLMSIDSSMIVFAALTLLVNCISSWLFRTLRFTEQKLQSKKSLLKLRMVMKDEDENLYALIRDGKLIIKATYDSKNQTITYSDLSKASHSKRARFASSAETLAFNFVYSSIKKAPKTEAKKSRVSKETDLIGKLLKKKAKEATSAYQILLVALCVEMLIHLFVPNSRSTYVMLFTCIVILLVFAKQYLLQYRVKKGLYGTCYSEAKEIISFISNNNPKSGSGLKESKLIFKYEEIETSVQKDLYKGEQHVQRN